MATDKREARSVKRTAGGAGATLALVLVGVVLTLAGCGEVTVPNPYSTAGEPVTLAQLDREADRQVAEAKAEAEAAAKSADRAAREELAEITNFRLDAEADLELAMATLRSQFAKADRAVDLKLTALQGDLEGALDAASRNFASKTSEIGSLRSAAAERIAAIEAQRNAIVGLIGTAGNVASGLGVPGAVGGAGLLTTILAGIGWARSSAKASAAIAEKKASDTAWDEATAAAEKQRTVLDSTWNEAAMQAQFNALLAQIVGAKTPTPNNVAGAAAGTGTDAVPAAA